MSNELGLTDSTLRRDTNVDTTSHIGPIFQALYSGISARNLDPTDNILCLQIAPDTSPSATPGDLRTDFHLQGGAIVKKSYLAQHLSWAGWKSDSIFSQLNRPMPQGLEDGGQVHYTAVTVMRPTSDVGAPWEVIGTGITKPLRVAAPSIDADWFGALQSRIAALDGSEASNVRKIGTAKGGKEQYLGIRMPTQAEEGGFDSSPRRATA